ncbi:hypothetical protein GNP35_07450 [Psychrosphaera haliotis]|uniref:Uncharacterized protein n=1 Tax=Psychrosphaera haliotis TaxID=555083 RepID=A0A6N8F6X2_9GAMM|nr:hypothetical protein [Psychrosphaera haliotis]
MYSSAIKPVLLITLLLNSNLVKSAVPGDQANSQTTNQLSASSLLFQDLKRYIPEQNVRVLKTKKTNNLSPYTKKKQQVFPKVSPLYCPISINLFLGRP